MNTRFRKCGNLKKMQMAPVFFIDNKAYLMVKIISGLLSTMVLLFVGCNSIDNPKIQSSWTWTSVSNSPVFTKLTNAIEDNGIGSPDVLIENTGPSQTFIMYYAQGGTDTVGRIGRATSPDGIVWTRSGTVLTPSGPGHFDDHFIDTPSIIKVGSTYYLYFFGDVDNSPDNGKIGLATSTDGINFARPRSTPVIALGGTGTWDEYRVESPDVVNDGNSFIMYYTGVNALNIVRTGRATSSDGITWTKDPANPIFDKGPSGAWDSITAYPSGYLLRGGVFEMYYISAALITRTPSIGLATSIDGRVFTRYANNPVMTSQITNNSLDGPINPCVIFDEHNQIYMLWSETGIGFYLARAPARL